MTTFGVAMVKDEADVIAGTLTHMADEVDHLLVADNNSTDGTREILAELEDTLPLTVQDDPEPAYYQSAKVSRLAEQAASMGAEWIVPFDADELWVAHEGRLADALRLMPDGSGRRDARRVGWVNVPLFNHFATAIDPDEKDPFRQLVWRQLQPGALPKVAFRWEAADRNKPVVHQGNHGVTLPRARSEGSGFARLEIRHFPYRSAEQFIRKARNGAAAYRASNLPLNQGAHWRAYGDILDRFGEEGLADVYHEHFHFLSPTDSGMVLDPAPYMRWRQP